MTDGMLPPNQTAAREALPWWSPASVSVARADALAALSMLPDGCAGLVYADPPFNTGTVRQGMRLRTRSGADGERTGFGGRRYHGTPEATQQYADTTDDYLGWLRPLLEQTQRVLSPSGTLYLHLDPRESHYCKVLLDTVFGRDCFLNEVIWAYDYGARSRRRWPAKHDVILVYVRDPRRYHFDAVDVERIPYLAPGLQTAERAAAGKLPTDVWWHTIVPTNSRERTGYPTQKPLGIIRRIVAASSSPGDLVVDWCAGSGTTGVAARELGRRALLVDSSEDAVRLIRTRLGLTAAVDTAPIPLWTAP